MLIINLPSSSETNLVNGSRGVVTGFSGPSHTPLVKFLGYENPIPIEHYYWEVADFEGVKQKQVPLRLAYALTIHKSQGSTLDSALIDVGPNTFEYGQAYVALSRVKDLESLYLWDIEKGAFKAHPKVIEFYRSIL
jgi:ATP-dependent DNA helicase PIF1